MEGVVTEMSLNYTNFKSIDGNYIFIPNRNVLKSDITNFTKYKYEEAINAKIARLKRFLEGINTSFLTQYILNIFTQVRN